MPMLIAQRFGHRAAGANPPTVGTLSPAPHDQRDDDEGLNEAKNDPSPNRRFGEDVINEERPR